jgi:hypothetical protein
MGKINIWILVAAFGLEHFPSGSICLPPMLKRKNGQLD